MSANAELLHALAVELSILTGAVWTTELTTFYMDYMSTPTGEKVSLEIYKDRIQTAANHPTDVTRYAYTAPKITTSAKRTPAAIAHDIANRLLPDARAYWQKCREEQARHDAKVDEINQIVATFETYGLKRSTWHMSSHDEESAELYGHGCKLRLYSNAEIYDFQLSHITTLQAIEVLKLLQTFQPSEL